MEVHQRGVHPRRVRFDLLGIATQFFAVVDVDSEHVQEGPALGRRGGQCLYRAAVLVFPSRRLDSRVMEASWPDIDGTNLFE